MKVQTIEKTAKPLKLQLFLSGILFWFSVAGIFIFHREAGDGFTVATLNLVLLVGSSAWFIFTRIRIWWHHE
jgi:hypothetical protein